MKMNTLKLPDERFIVRQKVEKMYLNYVTQENTSLVVLIKV